MSISLLPAALFFLIALYDVGIVSPTSISFLLYNYYFLWTSRMRV